MTNVNPTNVPNGNNVDVVSGATDYFAFDSEIRHTLPDGVSWVEIKIFTEGDRRRYQNKVNKDVSIAKNTGDMNLKLNPGDERYELLSIAIQGWSLIKEGKPFLFSPNARREFLDSANPKVIDDIEAAVREHNPWIGAELTIEDIDKEIERLQELREQKEREEAGN